MELYDKTEIDGQECYLVCSSEELPEGERKDVELNFEKAFITREDGNLYCFSRICPHMRRESMNKGMRRGNYIICPLHGYSYNMETGAPADSRKTNKSLKKFDIFEKDGKIYITAPEESKPSWACNL